MLSQIKKIIKVRELRTKAFIRRIVNEQDTRTKGNGYLVAEQGTKLQHRKIT